MTRQIYNLKFEGYILEANIDSLPAKSGIYGVYTCIYNQNMNGVKLRELIYIGESNNIRERVDNHEKWDDWWDELRKGEEICFNWALISGRTSRKHAEAAIIYKHEPTCNTEYIDEFPFDAATINTAGENKFMKSRFTIYPA